MACVRLAILLGFVHPVVLYFVFLVALLLALFALVGLSLLLVAVLHCSQF